MQRERNAALAPTKSRYRALLDASSALADQPTVKAVLHSLRDVLSTTCKIHGAHLWVVGGDGTTESWRSIEKRTRPLHEFHPAMPVLSGPRAWLCNEHSMIQCCNFEGNEFCI
jgi:hypothetical protein